MRSGALFFVLFSLLLSIGTGRDQAVAAEKQLALTEAVRLALEGNHEIRASKNSVAANDAEIGIARSFLLPKITFEERFMRTNNPPYAFMTKLGQERIVQQDFNPDLLNRPHTVNDFQTMLSFEQPLFVRKAHIGLDMSKKEHAAKTVDFRRKREETALSVARTYLMVQTTREYVNVSEQAVADAKEHLRIAELKYKSGLGLYSDTLRASTAFNEAEQRLVSAQKNYDLSKRMLGLLLGLSEAADAAEAPEIRALDINYYKEEALSRNDIKALELRNDNARNNIKLAESGYFPMLAIGGSYQMNDHKKPFGDEGDSWQIMTLLKWELFDGAKRENERTKAKYQAAEAEERLSGLKKAVVFKVYAAHRDVEEAKKNAELSKGALNTAAEGTRLVRVRYENALSPLVDLLDAQVSLDRAKANLLAKENEYRLAIVNLGYESGTLLKDLKIE